MILAKHLFCTRPLRGTSSKFGQLVASLNYSVLLHLIFTWPWLFPFWHGLFWGESWGGGYGQPTQQSED